MKKVLRIGTRESQLAVWQATLVARQLRQYDIESELVYIKSEGDVDLTTPLYEMGVQGIFTKTLDTALLNNRVDLAVHSMKDVPTQLARGIQQAAVLERGSYKDLLVYKPEEENLFTELGYANGEWSVVSGEEETKNISTTHYSGLTTHTPLTIATSSVRRQAQWLHRYPHHRLENLRGNVNTRLQKLAASNWNGAIFAAAGLERIALRPATALELDWMLPAPAQGAIMVVCRDGDTITHSACALLDHTDTAVCTRVEKDFLRVLMGGCSTPISALAIIQDKQLFFHGNILSPDGKQKVEIAHTVPLAEAGGLGTLAARQLLNNGGDKIIAAIRNAGI